MQPMSVANSNNRFVSMVVRLNVGGKIFMTTAKTLLSVPNTKLSRMIEGTTQISSIVINNGEYFIDRDPTHFHHIINFLRDGSLPILSCFQDRVDLARESKWYEVNDLSSWCGSEEVIETAIQYQQKIVLMQYAHSIKEFSMDNFRKNIKYYDKIISSALFIINQHSASQLGPWLEFSLLDLFDMNDLAQYKTSFLKSGITMQVLRCVCESLQTLGFNANSNYQNNSIQIDLWSPGNNNNNNDRNSSTLQRPSQTNYSFNWPHSENANSNVDLQIAFCPRNVNSYSNSDLNNSKLNANNNDDNVNKVNDTINSQHSKPSLAVGYVVSDDYRFRG